MKKTKRENVIENSLNDHKIKWQMRTSTQYQRKSTCPNFLNKENQTRGGGFSYFLFFITYFYPYMGRWKKLTNIFQMGWNHQLEKEKIFFKHTIIEAGRICYFHTQTVQQGSSISPYISTTLPETNSKFAPENGWLEYDLFPFGASKGLFSGANLPLVAPGGGF